MSDEGEEERGGKIYPHPQFDGMGIVELSVEMEKARSELDAAKEAKSAAQKKYDFLTMAALPRAMGWGDGGAEAAARLATYRREGGRGIKVVDKYFTSVLAENRLALHGWLKQNNCGSLVVETVNGSTLKAYVTDCVKNNKPYPAEYVKLSIVPTAQFY